MNQTTTHRNIGWEYRFQIDWGIHKPNAVRFVEFIEALAHCPAFHQAIPAHIAIESRYEAGTEYTPPSRNHSEGTLSALRHLTEPYKYADACYRITYQRPVYVQMWEEQLPQKTTIPRTFIIPERADDVNSLRMMHYDAGDLRYYRTGRMRHLNLDLITQELVCLANMGVHTIRGLNIHRDREPHRHSAVYHHEFDGYLEDIYIITGEYYPADEATRTIVLDTLFAEGMELRFKDTNDLPIVFSTGGTNGDLRHFYKSLWKRLRAHSTQQT